MVRVVRLFCRKTMRPMPYLWPWHRDGLWCAVLLSVSWMLLLSCTASTTTAKVGLPYETPTRPGVSSLATKWRVECGMHVVDHTPTCFMETFGTSPARGANPVPFRVAFYNRQGPVVSPGYATIARGPQTVRVDHHRPILDMQALELVEQMQRGGVALATYYVWPTGVEQMTIDLHGFAEAYHLLLQKMDELP